MPTSPNPYFRYAATASLFALLVVCVAWEAFLASSQPGHALLILKALPLAFALRGIARGNLYTCQWAAMLVLLYLMEGVVRAMSDSTAASVAFAWGEIVLSTVFFASALLYVRPAKKASRRTDVSFKEHS